MMLSHDLCTSVGVRLLFFNDTATTEIYTLSLHDALPICSAKNVIFTSGGTEANNTVLSPAFRRVGEEGAALLLAGAAEHACVLEGHRFPSGAVERIPVDANGIVDLARLEARLERVEGRAQVSIQAANNETGVLQPVAEAAALAHARGALIHT